MIISIRGTSGSGKSTVVRRVMKLYPFKVAKCVPGRKQPLYYILSGTGTQPLAILGHYESPCGGCDTIHTFDEVFELVRKLHTGGYHVLFEGVLLYCEVPRTVALVTDGLPLHVIALNTSIEDCVWGINQRRVERGDWEPVNPDNTIGKFNGTISYMEKLQTAGVPVFWEDRESAFTSIINLLNLSL